MSTGVVNPSVGSTNSSKVVTIFSGDHAAADEGSFYVSTLANTAATAVGCTTQALANTNPSLAIFNGQSAGGYNVYLRYIKARVTTVGGTNTSKNYSMVLDNVLVKLSTTGTAFGAPVSTNSASGVLSKATLYGGVNIAAAASASARQVGDGQVVGAVEVAFDQWIFTFGDGSAGGASLIGTATLVSARTIPCAPIVIAPQWWLTLGFWGASQAASANTIGWEVGYIERPSGQ